MEKTDRATKFVNRVIEKCQDDHGFGAKMRRAANPDLEYDAWGFLAAFNVDITNDGERLPFTLVGSAIAQAKPDNDGAASLGLALAGCYNKGNADQGEMRLRKLLACSTKTEVCRALRHILRLIFQNSVNPISYASLLNDLFYFNADGQERIKLKWASDFYRIHTPEDDQKNSDADQSGLQREGE